MTLLVAQGIAIEGRLKPSDVSAGTGELVAVVGPNGGGKTSLLRAIAGVERNQGSVLIDGEALDLAPPARRSRLVGFLPASREIAWPIAARDLVALGLPAADPGRIDDLLNLLELEPLAGRAADRLSTGERARVLLARALVARPRLLLLDEPLSNLDPYWLLRILAIVTQEVRSATCSALVAVHDLAIAERFDRLLLVNDGRIIADGAPGPVLASAELANAFRIEKNGDKWRIRPTADRRSSP